MFPSCPNCQNGFLRSLAVWRNGVPCNHCLSCRSSGSGSSCRATPLDEAVPATRPLSPPKCANRPSANAMLPPGPWASSPPESPPSPSTSVRCSSGVRRRPRPNRWIRQSFCPRRGPGSRRRVFTGMGVKPHDGRRAQPARHPAGQGLLWFRGVRRGFEGSGQVVLDHGSQQPCDLIVPGGRQGLEFDHVAGKHQTTHLARCE